MRQVCVGECPASYWVWHTDHVIEETGGTANRDKMFCRHTVNPSTSTKVVQTKGYHANTPSQLPTHSVLLSILLLEGGARGIETRRTCEMERCDRELTWCSFDVFDFRRVFSCVVISFQSLHLLCFENF